jgi:hypothetical protein
MSAYKVNVQKDNLCNIPELVENKNWDGVLIRLDTMKFYISYTDRKSILEALEAPVWIKSAAFCCKVVPSC